GLRFDGINWINLAATAERHGVLPIVGANLRRCDPAVLQLPASLAERLETAVFENALLKERDAMHLAEALARLRAVRLEAMLLKGAALDLLVYAEPWVAVSRDTDLLVRPLPGFQAGPEERELRSALYREGIECDLNRHHDVDMNGVLPIPFARIWQDARPIDFRGQAAWVMSPEDLLISLCINSCRKRFRRLKGLFDIAETVRRGADPAWEIDWERLARKARDYRCEGIVFAALLTAAETVGCGLPDGHLETPGPLGSLSPIRAGLLRGLVARALRTGSLDRPEAGGLLLSYASYRWGQAWRSLWIALTHPRGHRPPAPLSQE
ncbi:MAG: nucleotidyltransferase family protein, partial [Acidobacteriota bacterium]